MRRVQWLAPPDIRIRWIREEAMSPEERGNRACGPSIPTGCAPEPLAAGVVAGLLSGATGDYCDADDSRSRVLPANYAFGVWAPTYAGSRA
jgi:hypothetical protein